MLRREIVFDGKARCEREVHGVAETPIFNTADHEPAPDHDDETSRKVGHSR